MSEIFSARLIEQRNKKGLTQAGLANALDKKRSTISGYETEGKEPPIETLCEFAEFFGVSVDYLVGLSNNAGNRDDALFNANSYIKGSYLSLPALLRETVTQTYAAFYDILRGDMTAACSAQLNTYKELFSLIAEHRKKVKSVVESCENRAGLSSVSEILAAQNDFKYAVESLLDNLLQEDLRVALENKGEHL
ncbi:MAG: helix-turn-helix domain-containing protein [Eubacterium sp.]|nr:helix-turn-helix domain-containing protein [Eubacterium sp.]